MKYHEPSLAKWALCYAGLVSIRKLNEGAAYQAFTVAQPAAGAEWSFTVPAGASYRFETLFFTIVTSAVVANRILRLQITDGTNVVYEGSANASLTASATYRFGLARSAPDLVAIGFTTGLFLPDIWLPAGYVLQTSTPNKDVGDQYSAVRGIVSVSSADWS